MPAEQPVLPTPKQAFDHLFTNVHARTFFGGLAQRGYAPQSEKEAQDLLALSGKLKTVSNHPQVKAAEARNSPYARANVNLDAALGQFGLAPTQERGIALKQAAAQLAGDPAIYNAVLSLKAAQAMDAVAAIQPQA